MQLQEKIVKIQSLINSLKATKDEADDKLNNQEKEHLKAINQFLQLLKDKEQEIAQLKKQ